MNEDTESTARTLIADGKGILAADETPGTLTKRFDALGIRSTAESRCAYRELLFAAPDAATSISGVIMQDETIRQKSSTGTPLGQLLASRGIVPGIKVDTGAKPLALAPGETVTEGLDGLRERLAEYRGMGARFAKWRAVIQRRGTRAAPREREFPLAGALFRALSGGSRPIVDPEWFEDGSHRAGLRAVPPWSAASSRPSRAASVTESMLRNPTCVPGKASPRRASCRSATATLRAPARAGAVPGSCSCGGRATAGNRPSDSLIVVPGQALEVSFSSARASRRRVESAVRRDVNAARRFCFTGPVQRGASLGRYTDDMKAIPTARQSISCTRLRRRASRSSPVDRPNRILRSNWRSSWETAFGQELALIDRLARRQLPVGRPDLSL